MRPCISADRIYLLYGRDLLVHAAGLQGCCVVIQIIRHSKYPLRKETWFWSAAC